MPAPSERAVHRLHAARGLARAAVMVLALAACADPSAERASRVETRGDTTIVRLSRDDDSIPTARLLTELVLASSEEDTNTFGLFAELRVEEDGDFWLFDRARMSLSRFLEDGRRALRVGRVGSGPGEFLFHVGMATLPGGRLAHWDMRNARVTIFDSLGRVGSQTPVQPGFAGFNGLFADSAGALWLKRFAPGGAPGSARAVLVRLQGTGDAPDTLVPPTPDVAPHIYRGVSERGGTAVASEHSPRALWDRHRAGYFVVANGSTGEVRWTNGAARTFRVEIGGAPIPLAADERAFDRERIRWRVTREDPQWTWTGPDVPDTRPQVEALLAGGDGTTWVRVPRAGRPVVPPPDPVATGEPTPRWVTEPTWLGLDDSGLPFARARLAPGETLLHGTRTTLWTLAEDDDGTQVVRRYRMVLSDR